MALGRSACSMHVGADRPRTNIFLPVAGWPQRGAGATATVHCSGSGGSRGRPRPLPPVPPAQTDLQIDAKIGRASRGSDVR
jgi:hypothetical protein